MDAAISEPLVEVLLPPGRLDAFLDALVAQGLVIDVEQRVRLNSLLLCLAAERRLPDDPDALCRLITPVLSGSAAEQMVCETTFKTVFIGSVPTQPSAFRLTSDEGIKDHYARGNSWTAKAWLARGAMSATTALVIAAVVYLAIAYGVFWRNDFREAKPVEPTFGTIVRVDFEWLNNYPIEELAVPRQSPWNRTWRWFYTEYTPVKWTALLLPWIMCLGFLAWLYHRMLAYLRREGLKQNLRSLDLRFGNVKARFGDRKLIGALQPLRGLARTYLHVLDHDRTAVASAKAAGQFKPQFIEVAVPTDFVVLIDRRSPADHLADYNMEVVRTLRDAGLSVEILEFNNEPTLCHFQHMGEFLRLDAVVRRFPDSIILIFATAEQLIDPARQRLLPAVLALKSARRAILLTPDSGGAETPLERQICRRLGTTILRTTPAGVGELVSLLLGISGSTWRRPNSSGGNRMGVGPLLDLMTARPERWMQKVGPPRRERRHLRELLRGALDAPALRWLTATTVYPELRWPLTLSLKSAVSSSYGERYALDADLLLVSQLSWFRSGWMPDWTRSLLQQTLNEDEKKRVRRVILEAIGLGNQRPGRSDQGLQITFVDERARPAHRVKADSIMLDYLLPALQSSHRLFALPKEWARRLAQKRLWRLTGATAAAILVAAGASGAALSLLPIDECDLLAASHVDDGRIGPGIHQTVLRTFYSAPALIACQNAVDREESNGRYWYQLSRALGANPSTFAQALKAAQKSAELNYPAAYNGLGFRYAIGEGVPVDFEQSQRYYEKAVALGNTSSLNNLASAYQRKGETRRSFELRKQHVELGGADTMGLARFYLREDLDFVQKDVKKYIELLRIGAGRGNGLATSQLGVEYARGNYVPKDLLYANELYERGIRLNVHGSAASNLAANYSLGRGVPQDYGKATYWAIFGAKLGYSKALDTLFKLIESGNAKFKEGFEPPSSFDARLLLHR